MSAKMADILNAVLTKYAGTNIDLDFPSVGATENIIMAAVMAEGETVITNAALEAEVEDLGKFLNKMGAKITGLGTNTIRIKGVKSLNEVSYNIMPDRIEAGTILCAAAVSGGRVLLKNVIPEHLTPVLYKLEECGCTVETDKKTIILKAGRRLNATDIKTMPYPGFPTDMQPVFTGMLTLAKGTSIVTENIFESRFKYAGELGKMGAKINIEGKTAVVKGVKKLSGTTVIATDLRGGAAMVVTRTCRQRYNQSKKYRIYFKRI